MRKKLEQSFSAITWENLKSAESRSGSGSSLEYTAGLRKTLPDLLARHGVGVFLDAPCGDWNWMREVDLKGLDYIGMDIVEDIISENRARYSADNIRFLHGDITHDPLPDADIIMCRDCLFHLKFWLRWEFFKNFVASGIPLLLTTSHFNEVNENLGQNGRFRLFNMTKPPFDFPEPVETLVDNPSTSGAPDRILGLWSREQVEAVLRKKGKLDAS